SLYKENRQNVKELPFKKNFDVKFDNIKFTPKPADNTRKIATAEDREKANKMKARLWQVVEMENMQEGLKIVMKSLDRKEVSENLNIDQINKLIFNEVKNRP